VGRPEKTEPLPVCVDADVLIAGLLSRTGASHAILVLGEIGLLRLVLPEAAVAEVRRNLVAIDYCLSNVLVGYGSPVGGAACAHRGARLSSSDDDFARSNCSSANSPFMSSPSAWVSIGARSADGITSKTTSSISGSTETTVQRRRPRPTLQPRDEQPRAVFHRGPDLVPRGTMTLLYEALFDDDGTLAEELLAIPATTV